MPDRIEGPTAAVDAASHLAALADAIALLDLLEDAREVLVREYGIERFEASEWLCREAVGTNRRVRDVATSVVQTGRI